MDLISIAEHVGTQKSRLDVLNADPTISVDSLRVCHYAINGIEQSLTELITEPWVPVTSSGINVLIASTTENIRQTEDAIAEIPTADIETADHALRFDLALTSLGVLKFMLGTLIDAMARKQKKRKPNETVN